MQGVPCRHRQPWPSRCPPATVLCAGWSRTPRTRPAYRGSICRRPFRYRLAAQWPSAWRPWPSRPARCPANPRCCGPACRSASPSARRLDAGSPERFAAQQHAHAVFLPNVREISQELLGYALAVGHTATSSTPSLSLELSLNPFRSLGLSRYDAIPEPLGKAMRRRSRTGGEPAKTRGFPRGECDVTLLNIPNSKLHT